MCIPLSLQPGEFIHTLGDAHIYLNHVEPLKVQVSTYSVFLYLFIFHNAYPVRKYLGIMNILLQILIFVAFLLISTLIIVVP